jgi:uncharacterized membrane protein YqhA
MSTEQLISVVLGFAFGLVVAFAIFVADLAVRRLVHIGTLLDVMLRLGVVAVIVLGASELIGSLFGPLLRAHAVTLWSSFVVGFLMPPWLVHLHLRRVERKSAG